MNESAAHATVFFALTVLYHHLKRGVLSMQAASVMFHMRALGSGRALQMVSPAADALKRGGYGGLCPWRKT